MAPQPTITSAGSPERIITTTLYTRSVMIEAAESNSGDNMYVGTTESLAGSDNRSTITKSNPLIMAVDNYGDLDAWIDLNDLWFDGDISGDKLVITYIEDSTRLGKGLG